MPSMSNVPDNDLEELELTITPYFRIASIVILLIVIISALLIWIWKKELTSRTSFYLAFWSSICILVYHGFGFFKPDAAVPVSCALLNYFKNVSKLSAVIVTGCIAFNLHRVFIKKSSVSPTVVRWYVPMSILFSILVSTPGLAYSLHAHTCWLRSDYKAWTMIYWWVTSDLWMFIVLTYCLVIVILVFRIIHRERQEIKRLLKSGNNPLSYSGSRRKEREYNRVAIRIIMYPIVPILSFTPSLVTFTIRTIQVVCHPMSEEHFQDVLDHCNLAADFVCSWTGIFAGIAFMCDPVVSAAIHEIRVKYGFDSGAQKPQLRMDESGSSDAVDMLPIL
ncbi:hypothetical protein K493DRAFT_313225 [Basidiobolus meristosporus CBS 931.73]|uniref:G-protein coupled receptors family 2 profile 2 domain-containing protein n=1 Tax=Basidiobolus meristosporus CBS 931.73 TaxID=1314790 RepID=A0A1Y1YNW7_9FUNG|nr:hypothetical protein K493DRAFT_313225 [Basidiobolus meristosporus CBS 931.73]|eukprot:ORX99456.1 hypothetical protein K493DRAFT_313225 [Basidiobolus meristosporus CBS 931.73]